MSRFSVGEVVFVEKYGWGVVSQTQQGSVYLKIIFENDVSNQFNWWFTADRVMKLEDVTMLQGEAK